MATFPIDASESLRAGWSERERDNVIRSPMGYGPAKLRERTTAVMNDGTRAFYLTTAEKDTLLAFYATEKALIWDWDEGGGSRNYRFLSPPAAQEISCDLWSVSIQVEVMP